MNDFKINSLIGTGKDYIKWLAILGIGIACASNIAMRVAPANMVTLSLNQRPNPSSAASKANNQRPNPSSAASGANNKYAIQVDNQAAYQNEQPTASNSIQNRPLKLTILVDSPEFLLVKVGEEIKQGDVISDNSLERSRLDKQRKSLLLQINNIKAKTIPKPSKPKKPPAPTPLPNANFSEESAAIAQAQLKLQQAQETLLSRTPLLQTDNPPEALEYGKCRIGKFSSVGESQGTRRIIEKYAVLCGSRHRLFVMKKPNSSLFSRR